MNQSQFAFHPAHTFFGAAENSRVDPQSDANVFPNLFDRLTAAENVHPFKIKTSEQYQSLGLTGNIISATAHIPYMVGITKDGHFEITPRSRYSKLHESLSYLSSSTDWKHTIVGWTGEILPALSAEYGASVSQDSAAVFTPHDRGQLGKTVIHDVNSSGLKDSFVQHLKGGSQPSRDVPITKDMRKELETLLEHAFEDKILPVWLGDWAGDQGTLILRDQARWHSYADQELQADGEHYNGDQKDRNELDQKFADYRTMNEAVADAILKVYAPGDIVWIHDCNLMLVPDLVRQKLASAYICYYHHVAGSVGGSVTTVPQHAEMMEGLLGASVIALPTRELRQHFEDYYQYQMRLTRTGSGIVSTANRSVALIHVPVMLDGGVMPKVVGENSKTKRAAEDISRIHSGKKLILALACQDSPEGIRTMLDGYEYLLQHADPSLKQKIVLMVITTLDPPHYSTAPMERTDLDAESAARMTRINGKYGTAVHQPVVYVDGTSPPWEYVALLRLADLGIVTTFDARLHAMAIEFVVSQKTKCSPLLVCCRGAQHESTISPNAADAVSKLEAQETADKIKSLLEVSYEEKRQNYKILLDNFAKHNSRSFTNEFLIRACNSFAKVPLAIAIPKMDIESLSNAFRAFKKRLFMFDYDGTLTPIIDDPDAALPTEKLLTSLPKLATRDGNQVWIISGRSRDFLQTHFGKFEGVGLSAEHGSFVRRPGSKEWDNLAAKMDMQWKMEADKVFSKLQAEVSGSRIERKEVAIVWHYRNAADHDACLARAVDCKSLLEGVVLKNWDVDVMLGKANLEVRPRFLNKGAMAASLVREMFGKGEEGFVLCAGDDTTDEDMFRALLRSKLKKHGVFSCLVSKSDRPSLASFRVDEPSDFVDTVSLLSTA